MDLLSFAETWNRLCVRASVSAPIKGHMPLHEIEGPKAAVAPSDADAAIRTVVRAVLQNDIESLRAIIAEHGAATLHQREHLALRLAVRHGNAAIVDLIIQTGASIEAKGEQALRLAAVHNRKEIVDYLARIGVPLFRSKDVGNVLDVAARKVSGPIVFLHISKTAGTSLGAIFNRIVPYRQRLSYDFAKASSEPTPTWYWRRGPVAEAIAKKPAASQSEALFVSGHFTHRLREVLPPSRLVISMIREPVDRLVSGLYYGSGTRAEVGNPDEFRALFNPNHSLKPLDHYVYCDHQVRVLSADASLDPDIAGPTSPVVAVTSEVTDRVLADVADNFVLLGITERYQDSALVLARQLGLPLSAIVDEPRNRTGRRRTLDEVPQDALERLRSYNAQDLRLYAGAVRLLDHIIESDRDGFEQDRELLKRLQTMFEQKAGYARLIDYERSVRKHREPRLYYRPNAPRQLLDAERNATLYLDLLEEVLINRIYMDPSMAPWNRDRHIALDRHVGSDWPSMAHTMVGKERIHNLRRLCEDAVRNGVAGDFLEAGVWRGGATIMMRGVLQALGDRNRSVWVADSFAGVPAPNTEKYPADTGDVHFEATELAVSQAAVAENFRRYGLLDRQVRFLPGLFRDTLAAAPIARLSVLRLDGDLYESTMDALTALYDKISPGGCVIVDDYGAVPGCKAAVDAFRAERNIGEQMVAIDWAGVYWHKG